MRVSTCSPDEFPDGVWFFELAAVADPAAVPDAVAAVTILTTIRDGLGVADGQLWPVPSLDVGARVDSAAVALFVECAGSVAPRFTIDKAEEATTVVDSL